MFLIKPQQNIEVALLGTMALLGAVRYFFIYFQIINTMSPRKRGNWSEEALQQALQAIENGTKVMTAAKLYCIPRRTLRNHISSGSQIKRVG